MSSLKKWDFWAKYYNKLVVQKYSLKPTRNAVLREVLKIINDEEKEYSILDIGCGTGQTLELLEDSLSQYNVKLYGIDFSLEMLKRAIKTTKNVKYKRHDSNDIKKLKLKFDIVICTHSLPYYKNQSKFLSDVNRILKQGGNLILSQASENSIYDKIILSMVKLSTGKAKYPSIRDIEYMSEQLYDIKDMYRVVKEPYIPSIYLFNLKKNEIDIY